MTSNPAGYDRQNLWLKKKKGAQIKCDGINGLGAKLISGHRLDK